jgi:putative glutamine amidotransferase
MKPRIAVPIPTSTDLAYNQRSWPHYAAAVERSGGEAVQVDLTLSPAELGALAATCAGVVLPGSPADVDPALYGEGRLPECADADPAREAMDYALLSEAFARGMPVLAICYGMQSLNVWRGGSIVQDLAPLPVNHSAGGSVAIAHSAVVAEGSLLASLLTPEEAPRSGGFLRLPVNSSHHQAAAAPGEGLRIVARCPEDGVIEAVELDPEFRPLESSMFHVEHRHRQFLLGVQWHPERSYGISAASRTMFDRLVAEAAMIAERGDTAQGRSRSGSNAVTQEQPARVAE